MGWNLRILCAGLVVACGAKGVSPKAARIVDAEASDLGDCKPVGRVSGTGNDDAGEQAKNAARDQAADLGATHIRWIVPCCTTAEGDAYACDLPE